MKKSAFTTLSLMSLIAAAPASAGPVDPWTQVGAASKPSWVSEHAERRLGLVPLLPSIESNVQKEADGYFGTQGPGLSVGLILDDGLFFSKGFGFDTKLKNHLPNEDTVYRWGSLSKVMTSTALLSLIDDPKVTPKISINDAADASRFVPELAHVCPTFNAPCARGQQHDGIVLGELASHESGLPNVLKQATYGDEPSAWNVAKPPYLIDICGLTLCDNYSWMKSLNQSWLSFTPGGLQEYSGVGVELAGLIEQRISQKPYPDFVKDHLFEPLGMHHSTMNPTSVPDAAQAQMWEAAWNGDTKTFSFSPTTPAQALPGDREPMLWPAGGLATSVLDMSLFVKMWLNGKAPDFEGHPLLSADSFALAEKPFVAPGKTLGACAAAAAQDSNGNSYSACSDTNDNEPTECSDIKSHQGFAIGWWIENADPQMSHSGDEEYVSGSQTIINVKKKLGAVGAVSTEGYAHTDFMNKVVRCKVFEVAAAAPADATWNGQALAIAVARVLFLSGKTPSPLDVNAFTLQFRIEKNLTSSTIVPFLTSWQNEVGKCKTFRVRAANTPRSLSVRFDCEKKFWDVDIDVETDGEHKIDWRNYN